MKILFEEFARISKKLAIALLVMFVIVACSKDSNNPNPNPNTNGEVQNTGEDWAWLKLNNEWTYSCADGEIEPYNFTSKIIRVRDSDYSGISKEFDDVEYDDQPWWLTDDFIAKGSYNNLDYVVPLRPYVGQEARISALGNNAGRFTVESVDTMVDVPAGIFSCIKVVEEDLLPGISKTNYICKKNGLIKYEFVWGDHRGTWELVSKKLN